MRSSLPVLLATVALATPLAGQAAPAHIYWVGFYQALPGKAAAYNQPSSPPMKNIPRQPFPG